MTERGRIHYIVIVSRRMVDIPTLTLSLQMIHTDGSKTDEEVVLGPITAIKKSLCPWTDGKRLPGGA